jgi:hypothetical protein
MKNIDSIKHSKINRITTSYKKSFGRIKIDLPNKRSRISRFTPYLLIVFSFILFYACLSQTYLFQLITLASQIRGQSVLVGFQNSAELRPTGGFWGSFAVWDIDKNIFDSTLSFDTNPYKQDNKLLESSTVKLPEPMHEQWSDRPQSFVNANWSASFPQSAQTLQWYFGQGWGEKEVSAVFAISSLTLIDLLNLTGEINLPDKTAINSGNFTKVMSEKIDSEYWQTEENKIVNEPKTLIKELFPLIIKKTKALPKISLYGFFIKQIRQGRIIAYFNNSKLQEKSEELKIDGEFQPYKNDYLMINNANISGSKTSLNINQSIDYELTEDRQGLSSLLKITRSHKDLWPHHQNTNYTRVFVPIGSTLESVKLGTEDITQNALIEQDQGRTVFGFWFNTKNGEQKTAEIKYRIPSKNSIRGWELVYQKQPGTNSDWLNIKIHDKVLFAGEFEESSKRFLSR